VAVVLEIEDGDPWYLSPSVWAVPGPNPEGPPGIPTAGQATYLWARVRNRGGDAVADAVVRFYWANPAVGFDRDTANLVGTSNVSLSGGETADVLCLMPWFPAFVNQGHECILAEAFHASYDPLPTTAEFNVPTDRHVAQRNLSVVGTGAKMSFSFAFEIHNSSRKSREFSIVAREGEPEQVARFGLLPRGWARDLKPGSLGHVGFTPSLCPDEAEIRRAPARVERLLLGPRERMGYCLVGILESGTALIHVTQEVNDEVHGGLSVLVLPTGSQEAQ
jgi:hypothetical protein